MFSTTAALRDIGQFDVVCEESILCHSKLIHWCCISPQWILWGVDDVCPSNAWVENMSGSSHDAHLPSRTTLKFKLNHPEIRCFICVVPSAVYMSLSTYVSCPTAGTAEANRWMCSGPCASLTPLQYVHVTSWKRKGHCSMSTLVTSVHFKLYVECTALISLYMLILCCTHQT